MRHWSGARGGGPWRLDALARLLDCYSYLSSGFTAILEVVSI